VGGIDAEQLSIRGIVDTDIQMIKDWLYKDHIQKWYGDPCEWLEEIYDHEGRFDWITHCIIEYKAEPIGFCQYYDCSKTGKGYSWDNEPNGTFGIDYFIGEERYLGKKLGSCVVRLVGQQVIKTESLVQLIADPVPENIKSIRVLEKNGYVFCAATGLYKLQITEE
jgi:RimJ/RimL family protein N-acetyltransferase